MGRSPDALALFQELAAAPWRFDFYVALRRLESLHPDLPRLGRGTRPTQEPARFGQPPELAFAPASIAEVKPPIDGLPARVHVNVIGLLGPNGAMPLHVTELARERLVQGRDEGFARFLDLINHRFITLFYRAWAQAQPAASADRPADDRFADYIGSFIGLGTPATKERGRVPDRAKRFFAGVLARQTRDADGLEAICEGYFGWPVQIESCVGNWMRLRPEERWRLGTDRRNGGLGDGAVLGDEVWDRQGKFRLWIGPLPLQAFESFLPGGAAAAELREWVDAYLTDALAWDVRLLLDAAEVPPLALDGSQRLGWTTWLGPRETHQPADDLILTLQGAREDLLSGEIR